MPDPVLPSRPFSHLPALAVLAGLVLFAFLPTLDHGWAPLDDELNFVSNPHYRGLSPDHLRWMATSRHAGHYIPLSWLTLAADFELSGMAPRGYHRTNLLLHLANALLFYALAWRLLAVRPRGAPEEGREPAGPRLLAAFAAAALFAVHPLRVESVAWITERRDVLCGLFVLLTLHAWLSAAGASGRRRSLAYAGALLAFAAALLSKGIALMLPAALVALDLFPLGRLELDPRRWLSRGARAVLLEKLPFLALSALFAGVTFWAAAPAMADRTQAGLEHRLLSAGFGLSFYLEKTVVPRAIPFQVPATHPLTVAGDGGVALRGIVFLAVLAGALAFWRRKPAVPLALAVFTAFVLPVSGLFQAGPQLAAHRYTYLSALSLALLAGAGLQALARRQGRWGLAGLALLTLGLAWALAGSARAQAGLWRDDVTFCRAAVDAAPDAWAPAGALARAYLARGEQGAALAVLQAARQRLPDALLLTYLEAVLLATSPDDRLRDGELALLLATRAARTTSYQDPAALFALAAASAETGDLDAARHWLDGAEALTRAGRKPGFLPVLEAASRQIDAQGLVRLTTADWRNTPL